MLTRTHISTLLVLAVIVWGGALMVLGLPITWRYTAPFTLAVSVLTGACIVFERWIWRWRIFRGWLVKQPDIQGTWRVKITPTSVDSVPIDGVMVVRQSFSKVSARLFTKESSSYLISQNWVPMDDGLYQLAAVYQNTPGVSLRGQRSEIHLGSFLLDIRGDPPESIDGHYWTDRGTRGDIELKDKAIELATKYSDARPPAN
ncbi:MAG: hypothetical protein AB7I50_25420 [Vicinamibacterales bacterium]